MRAKRAIAGLNNPTVSDVSSHGIVDPSVFGEGISFSKLSQERELFSLLRKKENFLLYVAQEREYSSLCCARKRIIPDINKGIPKIFLLVVTRHLEKV